MPKPKSKVKVVKVTFTTSERIARFLDKLIETEIFGRSRAEVAEQIVKRQMEKFLEDPNKLDNLNREL